MIRVASRPGPADGRAAPGCTPAHQAALHALNLERCDAAAQRSRIETLVAARWPWTQRWAMCRPSRSARSLSLSAVMRARHPFGDVGLIRRRSSARVVRHGCDRQRRRDWRDRYGDTGAAGGHRRPLRHSGGIAGASPTAGERNGGRSVVRFAGIGRLAATQVPALARSGLRNAWRLRWHP